MIAHKNMNQETKKERIDNLVQEVLRGEHIMDQSINSSYDFSKAAQTEYFSRAKENMESEVGYCIMHDNQQLGELNVLRMLRGN